MTTFTNWLSEMQDAKLIGTRKADKPKRSAAELLGVTDDTVTNLIQCKVPFDQRTRLACKALLHRLDGY